MIYLRVSWQHSHPDEPTLLYSELDDDRWETRKVEIFREEKMDYASRTAATGSTMLGIEPIPPTSFIASNPEFQPTEITGEEFEKVWHQAITQGHL